MHVTGQIRLCLIPSDSCCTCCAPPQALATSMPKLRSLDLAWDICPADVEPSGTSLAAIAQLTALTYLSLSVPETLHWQDLTRLSSLSSLESLCL